MRQIIGITGGTGCGKSTATEALAALGVHVIDCDRLYHRLLETDRRLLADIEAAFPGVVEDGLLQRKKLGAQVFSDPAALARLNGITTGYVTAGVVRELETHASQPCAIDAIGLLESGLDRLCTHTVAVTAPEEVRVKRLMRREGVTEEYARLRIGAQKPNEYFAAHCGAVLHNSCETKEQFLRVCDAWFKTILLEEDHHE